MHDEMVDFPIFGQKFGDLVPFTNFAKFKVITNFD